MSIGATLVMTFLRRHTLRRDKSKPWKRQLGEPLTSSRAPPRKVVCMDGWYEKGIFCARFILRVSMQYRLVIHGPISSLHPCSMRRAGEIMYRENKSHRSFHPKKRSRPWWEMRYEKGCFVVRWGILCGFVRRFPIVLC